MIKAKVALVTGASRGIGSAIARRLAAEGASLVISARSLPELHSLSDELRAKWNTDVLAVQADLSTEEGVATLKAAVLSRFNAVDILVNNVGVGKYGPMETFTPKDYDWMMDTNMKSSFLCTHSFLPAMIAQKQGWIVFIGSVAGLKGMPHEALYCATKFAQTGFAQALDYEVRKKGIKVSLIAPGGVHTHFAFGTGRSENDPSLREMLDPEDVAEAVYFALTQPEKSRVFCIGMRPMSEPL